MGFTPFEKKNFRSNLRTDSDILQLLENQYPEDVVNYLVSENLLRQVRDYAIISDKPKPGKPENIVVTYLLSPKKTVYDILEQWQTFLSPPVNITI